MTMKINFDERAHRYTTEEGKQMVSVTQLIGKYFKPFDKECISKMLAAKRRVSQQSILDDWKGSADYGTEIHRMIEEVLLGLPEHMHKFNEVARAMQFIKPYVEAGYSIKPELKIGSRRWLIAGTIDVVIESEEGVWLVDWKTGKPITSTNDYGQRGYEPIEHIHDCKLAKYSLQLALYKKIYEEEYGKKVLGTYIVKLNPEGGFESIPATDYSKEVEAIVHRRLIEVHKG